MFLVLFLLLLKTSNEKRNVIVLISIASKLKADLCLLNRLISFPEIQILLDFRRQPRPNLSVRQKLFSFRSQFFAVEFRFPEMPLPPLRSLKFPEAPVSVRPMTGDPSRSLQPGKIRRLVFAANSKNSRQCGLCYFLQARLIPRNG